MAIDKGVNKTVEGNEENEEIINVKNFFNKFSDNSFFTPLQQIILKRSRDEKDELDEMGKFLEKLFDKTYKDNKVVKEIINTKTCGF